MLTWKMLFISSLEVSLREFDKEKFYFTENEKNILGGSIRFMFRSKTSSVVLLEVG